MSDRFPPLLLQTPQKHQMQSANRTSRTGSVADLILLVALIFTVALALL